MQQRVLLLGILLLISSLIAACGEAAEPLPEPSVGYELGEILLQTSFDDAGGFNTIGVDTLSFGALQFGPSGGEFQAIAPGGGYIWTLNNQTHSNVVMELTTEVLTPEDPRAIYGIMCRAHPTDNGIGYYFLFRGDGYFGIRRGTGEQLLPLVNWTQHPAIRTARNEVNRLRIICVEDYLALYINDQFAGEARYDWLREGRTGFALNGAQDTIIGVAYDDLTIWEATLTDTP